MSLSIGTKLGPYEILGPLCAGGMGEVYRALDTQLDREVAVKVLPQDEALQVAKQIAEALEAVWSAATHELLFLGGDDRIMAASYTTQGDAFSAGVPRVWSPTQVRRDGVLQNFDIPRRQTRTLARKLSELTGETLTSAIQTAVAQRYERVRREKSGRSLVDELNEIALRCAARPRDRTMTDDEILGYDEFGAPTR